MWSERQIEGDGSNHRWLYLLKATVLVLLFPQRSVSYPIYDTIVATCDFHGYPDDLRRLMARGRDRMGLASALLAVGVERREHVSSSAQTAQHVADAPHDA